MVCDLLGAAHGVLAQLALAFLAFVSLCVKRHTERPRRAFQIWVFDVSKQAFAAGAAHGCGMLWAILMHRFTHENASECAWYFVVFSVDTTCGVAVALYLHALVLRLVSPSQSDFGESEPRYLKQLPAYMRSWAHSVAMCGFYGDPPSLRVFLPQMVEFVVCVIAGRVVCGAVVFAGAPVLGYGARWMDAMFYALFPDPADSASAELWTVMVAGPLTMNIIQVLVQDAFLKWKGGRSSATSNQPLLEPFGTGTSEPYDTREHQDQSPSKRRYVNFVSL